jgi:PadR family transcriptional regulator, regulatory protein PadR
MVVKGYLDALVLAVVASAEGPLHGYAVVERLRMGSGGRFDVPEGTVYPVLHQLERDGLLSSGWTVVAGRKRREYELTARGRRELGVRSRDWRVFADAVERLLAGGDAGLESA